MVTFTPIRPKARPSSVEERAEVSNQRRLQAEMADLEFRVDLEPHMDDVADLGYSPGSQHAIFRPVRVRDGGKLAGMFLNPRDNEGVPDWVQENTANEFKVGDVALTIDNFDRNEVWAHEIRHRGLELMRQAFTEEEVTEKYGEAAASLLYNRENEEALNDLMDRFDSEGNLNSRKPKGLSDSSQGFSVDEAFNNYDLLTKIARDTREKSDLVMQEVAYEGERDHDIH